MDARTAGRVFVALAIASVGCGAPRSTAATTSAGDRALPPAPAAVEGSELQRLNARAREGAVTETLHGVAVEDPFRALESEAASITTEWIDAQNARTDRALAQWIDPEARARIDALLSIGTVSGPAVAGDRLFYAKREGDREQPALYVHERGALRSEPLIDPLTYGPRAALDWYFPSPSGRYVAFGISENGDERSTLRVLDVTSGAVLPDVIAHTKWSAIAWLHSEAGFYYRRYPKEGEPDFDEAHQDTYHPRIFFHRLGADPAADPLVFAPRTGTDFPSPSLSDDDRWLVVNNYRGWSQTDVHLFDRGRGRSAIDAPTAERPLTDVVVGQDHLYTAEVHRGRMFITTNEDAPRYRVMSAAPEQAADRARWQVVIAEGPGAIEGVLLLRDRIAVHTIENIASTLRIHRLDGRLDREIALPGRGEIDGFDGDPQTGRLAITFSSFVHPPALFTWTARDRELAPIDRVQTDVDFADLELSQTSVPSADGTPINVYYVHRRGMPLVGSNRVLLTAYGGFNVSLLPGFQRNALYWVERGGVYAQANLRGGGEHGEDWHRAGNLANKPRVFEDMEAVTRWLGGASNISRPERIALTGGSNGGLLMGAMITRAPETFGAAVASVGLYDMVRYHRFPPAELWITEYGSAEDAAQFGWLHAYSPYHQVRAGVDYPAVLITTADHDSRVHWAHSTKFAARLQEASGRPDPDVYFLMTRQQGHGAGMRLTDNVDRYVRLYAFIEHVIGRPGT